jgi:cyclopropane fatty-acyl-phospholipid synthase-like methyltransferase
MRVSSIGLTFGSIYYRAVFFKWVHFIIHYYYFFAWCNAKIFFRGDRFIGYIANYQKTIRKLSENYQKTIKKLSKNYQKTIRKLSENYSITIRKLSENYQKTIGKLFNNYSITIRKLFAKNRPTKIMR